MIRFVLLGILICMIIQLVNVELEPIDSIIKVMNYRIDLIERAQVDFFLTYDVRNEGVQQYIEKLFSLYFEIKMRILSAETGLDWVRRNYKRK